MTIKAVKTVLRILAIENKDRGAVKDVMDFLLNALEHSDTNQHKPMLIGSSDDAQKLKQLVCYMRGWEDKAKDQPLWVRTTDRLPEMPRDDDTEVIVIAEEGFLQTVFGWFLRRHPEGYTHWLPLPQLPKQPSR